MMICNHEHRAGILNIATRVTRATTAMIVLSPKRRVIAWTLLGIVTAGLCYLAFRGYLSADMLLNFANSFYC